MSSAKVGPDFIDPGYHCLATGQLPRNLDEWICGSDAILPLAAKAFGNSSILIIEGVMGLFDGAVINGPSASTASIADLTDSPVLLVVDCSNLGQSVVALVRGFLDHHPSGSHYFQADGHKDQEDQKDQSGSHIGIIENASINEVSISKPSIVGIILNKVANSSHAQLLVESLSSTPVPILGILYRDERFHWRDRHLGLIPVVEHPETISSSLDVLAGAIEESLDLDAIYKLAIQASSIQTSPPPQADFVGNVQIGVASGPAFSFLYQDNIEQLQNAGAEIVEFNPLSDETLPIGVQGLLIGGGFPETYAKELGDNISLNRSLANAASSGMPIWAECGGMAWLAKSLDSVPMSGVIDASVSMSVKLILGYRRAQLQADCPIGVSGTKLLGHEFHYSNIEPQGSGLTVTGRNFQDYCGYASPSLFASYLHLHLGSNTLPAENFVRSCVNASQIRNC